MTDVDQQKEWDAVATERKTGIKEPVAAVEPQKEPEPKAEVKAEPVVDPALGKFDEIIARIDKFDARVRNVEGHIGGLTSQQNALRETLNAAQQAAAKVTNAPTAAEVKDAVASPEQWTALKADFPEWAAATEALLDSRLSSLPAGLDPDAVQKIVSEQVKGQTEAVRGEIIDSALDAVYPGWKDEVKTEPFGKWLDTQSAEVKALAESPKVGDAARMLKLYESSKDSSVTTHITQNRQSKLDAAASAPTKSVGKAPGPKSVEDMSADELWAYEAKQRAKRKQSL